MATSVANSDPFAVNSAAALSMAALSDHPSANAVITGQYAIRSPVCCMASRCGWLTAGLFNGTAQCLPARANRIGSKDFRPHHGAIRAIVMTGDTPPTIVSAEMLGGSTGGAQHQQSEGGFDAAAENPNASSGDLASGYIVIPNTGHVFKSTGNLEAFLASADGTASRWAVPTGEWKMTYKGHDGPVECLTVSGSGGSQNKTKLFTGGADGFLRVWDVDSGEPIYELRIHVGRVLGLCIPEAPSLSAVEAETSGGADSSSIEPPPPNTFLSCSDDGLAKFIDYTRRSVIAIYATDMQPTCVTYKHSGTEGLVCVGTTSGKIRGYHLRNARHAFTFQHHKEAVCKLAVYDGDLFSCSEDGEIVMWNVPKWEPYFSFVREAMSSSSGSGNGSLIPFVPKHLQTQQQQQAASAVLLPGEKKPQPANITDMCIDDLGHLATSSHDTNIVSWDREGVVNRVREIERMALEAAALAKKRKKEEEKAKAAAPKKKKK